MPGKFCFRRSCPFYVFYLNTVVTYPSVVWLNPDSGNIGCELPQSIFGRVVDRFAVAGSNGITCHFSLRLLLSQRSSEL